MKEFVRIIKTFWAYVTRPKLYPELFRKIYKVLFNRKMATLGKEKALFWLKENAITNTTFLGRLSSFDGDLPPFSEVYRDDFAYAQRKQLECPIQMGGAGNLDLLYHLCEDCRAVHVLETGVAYGWSSLAILTSIQTRNGTLYSSDMPYLSQNGDAYVGCVVPEKYKAHWKLYRYADRESLPAIFKECTSFDLVHYDSDKSYNGMMWAYKELFPKIKKGGYLVSDDINDNAAFMDFCETQHLNATVIEFEDKYIGVIQK